MSDLLILGTTQIFSPPKPNISSATITLGPSLTYTGPEQTQTVASVVLGGTTLVAGTDYTVTDNTAINAGTYTLSVIAQGDYDGVATASWTIAKAAGSVSLDKTELSLDSSNVTDTITVTRTGNGTISATSSDTSIATVSVSGNIVTVTGVATGDVTITVSVAAGDNHLATSTTASVSVQFIGALDQCTPAQIQAVAQAGMGSQYWQVGDYTALISIDSFTGCTTATETRAFILGFDHNASLEGRGIHFQIGASSNNNYYAYYSSSKFGLGYYLMNNSSTNAGGWASCYMRTYTCPAFKSALPLNWQSVIKDCVKYTGNDSRGNCSGSQAVTSIVENVFLLAQYEVCGTSTNINRYESSKQVQYDFFINGNTKKRYNINNISTAVPWWLRSPTISSSKFAGITSKGSTASYTPTSAHAFAPAFVIG